MRNKTEIKAEIEKVSKALAKIRPNGPSYTWDYTALGRTDWDSLGEQQKELVEEWNALIENEVKNFLAEKTFTATQLAPLDREDLLDLAEKHGYEVGGDNDYLRYKPRPKKS